MEMSNIDRIALGLGEKDYIEHKKLFLRVVKGRYPQGVPEDFLFLLLHHFMQVSFEGKDPDLRDAICQRILEDVIIKDK
jgi:hypothetical protein